MRRGQGAESEPSVEDVRSLCRSLELRMEQTEAVLADLGRHPLWRLLSVWLALAAEASDVRALLLAVEASGDVAAALCAELLRPSVLALRERPSAERLN